MYGRSSHTKYPTKRCFSQRLSCGSFALDFIILLEVVPLCSNFLSSQWTGLWPFSVVAFLRQICVYSFLCSDMNLVSSKHSKCYSDQARDCPLTCKFGPSLHHMMQPCCNGLLPRGATQPFPYSLPPLWRLFLLWPQIKQGHSHGQHFRSDSREPWRLFSIKSRREVRPF